MKTLLVALAVLGTPAAASAADLSGTWAVKSTFGSQIDYTLVCVFKSVGGSIVGPCANTQGPTLRTTGRTTATGMSFKYFTNYNGGGVYLKFRGANQPDGSVRGVVDAGSSTGQFEATRLSGAPAGQTATWKVDVAIGDDLHYLLVCTFRPDGDRLDGPCVATEGPTLRTTGTVDGSRIRFGYDTQFRDRSVHVAYSGTLLDDGSLQGAIDSGSGTGRFTATRR